MSGQQSGRDSLMHMQVVNGSFEWRVSIFGILLSSRGGYGKVWLCSPILISRFPDLTCMLRLVVLLAAKFVGIPSS